MRIRKVLFLEIVWFTLWRPRKRSLGKSKGSLAQEIKT